MRFEQIDLGYQPHQDRLLLRISSDENTEFQFWVTRLMVKNFWAMLLKADEAFTLQMGVGQKNKELPKKEEGHFGKPYDEKKREKPWGENPLLVQGVKLDPKGPLFLLSLVAEGRVFSIDLDPGLTRSFFKMISDVVNQLDWGLYLSLENLPASGSVLLH